MWHSTFRHVAVLAGQWKTTPVGKGVGGLRVRHAVCCLTPQIAAFGDFGRKGGWSPPPQPRSMPNSPVNIHRRFLCLQVEMWVLCFLHHAYLEGTTVLTPFLASWACLLASFFSIGILSASSLQGQVARHHRVLIFLCVFIHQARPTDAVHLPKIFPQPAEYNLNAECTLSNYLQRQVQLRPLPTPCRSKADNIFTAIPGGSDLDCSSEELVTGPTLLEAATREMNGRPYWEAATLLDTLVEHFAHGDNDVARSRASIPTCSATADVSSSGPSVLRLAQFIPSCPVYDVTPVTLNIGRTLDEAVMFFNTNWELPQTLPDGLRLHASTAQAFGSHLSGQVEETLPGRYDIYTDGSFDGSKSSWSFAVLATWHQVSWFRQGTR